MVEWLAWTGGGLVAMVALVAVSHRMLVTSREGGAGGTDAFGGLVDVFEPARARADRDLETQHTLRQETGSPDPDDAGDAGPPAGTIVDGRSIRIRRPDPS